jgi:hypothetical protein
MKIESGAVVYAEGMTWLGLRSRTLSSFGQQEEEVPVARALMLLQLHTDTTQCPSVSTTHGRVTAVSTTTRQPHRTLAVVATPDGIESRECAIVPSDWHRTVYWPFQD